ncbi:MAG: serine hydrolase domain-containing protein [Saprospiraceae bacterium]
MRILFILLIAIIDWNMATSQSLEQQFQKIIDEVYAEHPDAIGIITSVKSTDFEWNGAVGYSDKNKTPIDAQQPALIASSIKTYVAATTLMLVEAKKLTLNQPIKELLPKKTTRLFEKDGYDFEAIQLKHLLSHTSGIEDYFNDDYQAFITKNPKYRWTRKEQLKRAVEVGQKLNEPGEQFAYADVNFVLACEIIEKVTGKPFYTAIRELLDYKGLELNHTWFPTLEEKPANTLPLIHQYVTSDNWDSYDFDPSWDLYGGGGIAATGSDMANFLYAYFNQQIIKDKVVQKQIYTIVPTKQREIYPYFIGLYQDIYHNMFGFGHGGFWGTQMLYFPEINTSISVIVSDRDKRDINREIIGKITKIIQEHQQKSSDFYDNQNQIIDDYLDKINDFSGTILVAQQGKFTTTKVSGYANKEFQVPNEVSTKFNIASITKTFTAVATLQLYDKELIDLQKTVGEYLPNYPNKTVRDSVTIHQLLTHTSGLPPFYGKGYLKANKIELKNVSDFVPLFANEELMFPSGSKYNYNGSGFVILGLIIEKISNQNYYDYLEKNVFEIANMPNTLAIPTDSIVMNKANGYTSFWGDNDYYSRNDSYISMASPAGFHYSTVEDLYNFSLALRNGKLLKPETYQLMIAPKVKGFNTHIGYGIDVDKRYDEVIIGHAGGWFGVRCEWMDFLGSDYTIIVLSNEDDNGESKASKVIEDLKNLVGRERIW